MQKIEESKKDEELKLQQLISEQKKVFQEVEEEKSNLVNAFCGHLFVGSKPIFTSNSIYP